VGQGRGLSAGGRYDGARRTDPQPLCRSVRFAWRRVAPRRMPNAVARADSRYQPTL